MKEYIKQFGLTVNDDDQRIYRCDDYISGRVTLEISKALRLSSFKVRLHGRAKSMIRKGKSVYAGFATETHHIIDSTVIGRGKGKIQVAVKSITQ